VKPVVTPHDPLGYGRSLPLTSRYYPMGFPVDLATNSEDILAITDRIWGPFPATSCPHAATLRVAVDNHDASIPPVPSMPRGQNHLVSIIQGPDNFAIVDTAGSFAFASLTQDVARDRAYVRYHFLEPAVYYMIDAAHLSPVHASCVALNGRAVVLCGDAGAGKTSLAYACARSGWTYLSDDATHIVRNRADRAVVGRPFRIRFRESARRLFPELNQFTPERRPNGKLDIEVDTSALGLSVALESKASHVVFLNRQQKATATVEPFPRGDAPARLQNLICYGDERVRQEQNRALTEFLRLPIVELKYGDPAGAEHALRELVSS
jgi:hypothetical protein